MFFKWSFKKTPLFVFGISALALVILFGCQATGQRDLYYKYLNDLEPGMSYDQVLKILGPPGDYSKNPTLYLVDYTHPLGPIERHWATSEVKVLLGFDLNDELIDKWCFFSAEYVPRKTILEKIIEWLR